MEERFKIKIDAAECIRCGRCVRVCPSKIFCRETPPAGTEPDAGGTESGGAPGKKGEIGIRYPESCIGCGHCVAACPADAVKHTMFPPEKIHPAVREALPSPEQVLALCRVRRSNRAFRPDPVPEAFLEQILEAAHRAPTASNLQQVEFTLVTDPAVLKEISRYTVDVFSGMLKKLENPLIKPLVKRFLPQVFRYVPVFRRFSGALEKGEDLILRGATAVLFIHTPSGNRFGGQDANLAYQNGSLMAESLGVSQFYTGFVCTAILRDKHRRLERRLGIEGTVHAGMALGMPAFPFPNYIDKKEIRVNRI